MMEVDANSNKSGYESTLAVIAANYSIYGGNLNPNSYGSTFEKHIVTTRLDKIQNLGQRTLVWTWLRIVNADMGRFKR